LIRHAFDNRALPHHDLIADELILHPSSQFDDNLHVLLKERLEQGPREIAFIAKERGLIKSLTNLSTSRQPSVLPGVSRSDSIRPMRMDATMMTDFQTG
jgi:hypothetical protein